MNHLECTDALPLIGAYTDGELSEAQAGPLRQHLMSCHACRNSAQANKASRGWFQEALSDQGESGQRGDDLVPAGFAARVARLAFAGETGEHAPDTLGHLELTPSAAVPVAAGSAPRLSATSPRRHLGFVLEITGIAAAVLVALTVAFRMREVPSGQPLRADETLSVQEIKDRLGELNTAVEAPANLAPEATQEAATGSDREQ